MPFNKAFYGQCSVLVGGGGEWDGGVCYNMSENMTENMLTWM